MQRAVWQDESEVFGEEDRPEVVHKRIKAPWESLSKTSVDLRNEAEDQQRLAGYQSKPLWASLSEADANMVFEKELEAADYKFTAPWDQASQEVIAVAMADQEKADGYEYEAIWERPNITQSRLEQLAMYELESPWDRDGGDENDLKDKQAKKHIAPQTMAPWKIGSLKGPARRVPKHKKKATSLWSNLEPKGQKKNNLIPSGDPILDMLREKIILNINFIGLSSLAKKFMIIDSDKSGYMSHNEFSKGCKLCQLELTETQIKHLFRIFDKDNSGEISYDEFLVGIRGEMNERRKQMVLLAFQVLDKDKSGKIDIDDMRTMYDVSTHPDILNFNDIDPETGEAYDVQDKEELLKAKQDEILTELINHFDGGEYAAKTTKDGIVTAEEFIKYYENVSASIDSDDYFELMIRNAWHISGGTGWSANSSNLRVLVTDSYGNQKVEEVPNDMDFQRKANTAYNASTGRNDGMAPKLLAALAAKQLAKQQPGEGQASNTTTTNAGSAPVSRKPSKENISPRAGRSNNNQGAKSNTPTGSGSNLANAIRRGSAPANSIVETVPLDAFGASKGYQMESRFKKVNISDPTTAVGSGVNAVRKDKVGGAPPKGKAPKFTPAQVQAAMRKKKKPVSLMEQLSK